MGDITKGKTWINGEVVTPAKLHEFLDEATINNNAVTTAKIATDAVTSAKLHPSVRGIGFTNALIFG